MHDELAARQRAITLRLAGRPTKAICAAVGRSAAWFRKWWGRYLEAGPEGLYDLTRANHHVAQRIPPELERAILSVRRRLQAHATPATRYCLIGATAILAELKGLGVRPLPCERTVERVLERNHVTAPRVRLAPLLPRQEYPGPQARASNDLHEVDLVGPIYLQGRSHRYYLWVGKDAFDDAVCLRLAESRRMDEVLWFLGECWKDLGIPEQVQFDNARELAGWGPAARTLSRVIRLGLRKLPARLIVPTGRLPLSEGHVTLIRRVSGAGAVTVLSQTFRVGKRHRGLYLRLVVDTGRGHLTAYLNGRVLKRWLYKLLNDEPTSNYTAAVGSR
jgi:putative transposase